jgi:hypothetical protein
MSITHRLKEWLINNIFDVLEWSLGWILPFIIYPIVFLFRVIDFIRPVFCHHRFSKYDPQYCFKCGKTFEDEIVKQEVPPLIENDETPK